MFIYKMVWLASCTKEMMHLVLAFFKKVHTFFSVFMLAASMTINYLCFISIH